MIEAKITFSDNFPQELRPRVLKYLKQVKWLIPRWCQEILIGWDASNINGCLCTRVHYEYRYIKITVTPLFLGQGEDVELEQFYHEIIHGLTSYLADYAREIIDLYIPKDESAKTNKMLHKELTRKNEAVTQDFAYAIAKKFES